MSQFQTIKTQGGLGLEAAADTGGQSIKLVAMSVGDGNGKAVSVSTTQTGLIHEVDRVNLNQLRQNPADATQWVAEAVFPADRGGYTVREVGLWTDGGVLFAVANFPDTYKPAPSEGTAGQLIIELNFRAANSDNVTLVVDGALQLATQDWVQEKYLPLAGGTLSGTLSVLPSVKSSSGTTFGGSVVVGVAGQTANSYLQTQIVNGQPLAILGFQDGNGWHNWTFNPTEGMITTPSGNPVPEVMSFGGARVVEQAFIATGSGASGSAGESWVAFPVAFKPGTTPIVTATINREAGAGVSRAVAFGNIGNSSQPNISNTGFSFQPWYATGGSIGASGQPWTLHVRAIGEM